ncbi:copper resistance CopC family protein [Lentzea sp. NEAU-D7]|uniref:copper resistance CopC family protein n=1 Tax=Lentzea sp. NEAU-D7 TaxID=2994667 RepID=UPI00224A79B1|nr:copper resistance CopC family protein [Lentzea sp. NEAU-D7]MCX2949248.1 copper resistance protein CopC [Lentzea sp. NEAU-D7]
MTRYLSVLVLALLAAMAMAVPAQAHAELKSSNPASGAALAAPPEQVELVFSAPVQLPDGDAVTVTAADGTKLPVTQVQAVDRTITAKIDTAAAKSGAHTVAWSAKSDDGDTVNGTFGFTMTVVAQSTSASAPPSSVTPSAPVSNTPPPAASSESGGVPVWVWIAIGLAVVVGAILLVRRRKPETP